MSATAQTLDSAIKRFEGALALAPAGTAGAGQRNLAHLGKARALLDQDRPGAGGAVYEQLREAMRCYEQAEARRPAGNDDAILRWNACTRLLRGHPELIPAAAERLQPYVDH